MSGVGPTCVRVTLAVVLAAALAGCTGGGGEVTPTSPSGSASASGSLAGQYLPGPSPTPIASGTGNIRTLDEAATPARADVLAVDATAASTALRWSLSTAEPVKGYPGFLSAVAGEADTSAVVLTVPGEDVRLEPSRYDMSLFSRCTCAWAPARIGPEGYEMSSLFPELPADATQVEVRIPGFDPITAPVTRK